MSKIVKKLVTILIAAGMMTTVPVYSLGFGISKGQGAVNFKTSDSMNNSLAYFSDNAPIIDMAFIVDDDEINLVMNTALKGETGDPNAFVISGTASKVKVTGVEVSEALVSLKLSANVLATDGITLSYKHTGKKDLTDGTPVADFSNLIVSNMIHNDDLKLEQGMAPTVTDGAINKSKQIELTMSGDLKGDKGDPSAFTISGAASNPKVIDAEVVENKVILSVDKPIMGDENIKVSYRHNGTNDLTDGTPVVDFSNCLLINNLGRPALVQDCSAINERYISLTVDNELINGYADPNAFKILNAANKPFVKTVVVSGNTITLELSRNLIESDKATVEYKHTGTNDLSNGSLVKDFTIPVSVNMISDVDAVTNKKAQQDVWTEKNYRPDGNTYMMFQVSDKDKNLMYTSTDINRAVAIKNDIYMINNDGTVMQYNTIEDKWIEYDKLTDLAKCQGLYKLVVSDDKIYIVGAYVQYIYVYDPATKKCDLVTNLPGQRAVGAAIAVDNKIYVISSFDITGQTAIKNLDVYDIAADKWTRKQDILDGGDCINIAYLDGKIYAFNSSISNNGQNIDVYDISTDKWSRLMPFPNYWFAAGMAAVNGKLYFTPSYYITYGDGDNMKEFDPNTMKVKNLTKTYGKFGGYATVVCNGEIYIIDGLTVQKYTPPAK